MVLVRTFTTTHTFSATLTPGSSFWTLLLWLLDWLAPVRSEALVREERPVSKPQGRFDALFTELDRSLNFGYASVDWGVNYG